MKNHTLYLECLSGVSGDMTVAALLDLGADKRALTDGLASLNLKGYTLKIGQAVKNGITACDFDVVLDGHSHDHNHDHNHDHDHNHNHNHDHIHRGINEINAIIDNSEITGNAKAMAKRIFSIVANAEAKVHGLPVEDVHFHEVGAVDSIVDITGVAICLDNLGISRVFCTPLSEGQGTVLCQHGIIPVPAPATLEIAKAYKIPMVITDNKGEMVTPTGIAIIAALNACFSPPSCMTVLKTGYGAGKRNYKTANLLRASIIEDAGDDISAETDDVLELVCNIDDMTGEQLAFAARLMLEKGALDCWLTPIIMKKSRPAQMLSLLIRPEFEEEFTRLLFRHTSTGGVRIRRLRRNKMRRQIVKTATTFGELEIKEFSYGDICKTSVEYDSANKLATACNIPISQVYREGEANSK